MVDDGSVVMALHGAVAWGAEAINRVPADERGPLFARLLTIQADLEALREEWLRDAART
jgi:hypothetical protein